MKMKFQLGKEYEDKRQKVTFPWVLICLFVTSATDCIAYDISVFGKRLRSSVARNMEQPSKSDFRARNIVKQEANSGGKVNGCIVHARFMP